jgi:valyl-tRNA synthetase
MSSGQDVRFSEDKIAQGLQLTNKLWNASRLILLRIDPAARAAATPGAAEDEWILSRLARAKTSVHRRIETYDFSHAALELYEFVYAELCDWYLELVKPRLYDQEPDATRTLLYVLTETLMLAHPIIPFVTEEIYSHLPGAEGLLAARVVDQATVSADETAEASLDRVIEAIQALRAWRDFAGVKAGARVRARLAADGYEGTADHLERLAKLSFGADGGPQIASVPVPGGTVEILPSEGVDLAAAERKRAAERDKLTAEIERSERKLGNHGFVDKAPAQVVAAERDKLARLRAELEAL